MAALSGLLQPMQFDVCSSIPGVRDAVSSGARRVDIEITMEGLQTIRCVVATSVRDVSARRAVSDLDASTMHAVEEYACPEKWHRSRMLGCVVADMDASRKASMVGRELFLPRKPTSRPRR